MYLKSLEMQGFKSFPDKTKLVFESNVDVQILDGMAHGVTVIVGPNGSGKSNIADAMRWVLGEISSKSLRGSKMEDVIFGGADSRRPMGYAEVSVTFDNRGEFGKLGCPYDEITVTRRYYRAGESEYFINRKGVRLRDIYELFMNTGVGRDGYSIIGQGRIAEMVSRKSEERRSVFEDASGIAKFRFRKKEAERKLEVVHENMDRANDIFSILSKNVGPLEQDAEKAKKAMGLLEIKKKCDVSLWLYDTEKIHGEITATKERFDHASYDLENADTAISSLEAQNQRLMEASATTKKASEDLLDQIQKQTEELHRLDSEYRVAENTIKNAKDLIAGIQDSSGAILRSIEAEEKNIKDYAKKIADLEAKRKELEEKTTATEEEQKTLSQKEISMGENVATALEEIQTAEKDAVDASTRISMLEQAISTETDKNSSALEELQGYVQESERLSSEVQKKEKTIGEYQAQTDSILQQITQWNEELSSLEEQEKQQTADKNQAVFRKDSLEHRCATIREMEENLDGYSHAVKYVMQKYSENAIHDSHGTPCGKIYGPLSKLITVEDKYLTAIDVALGNNAQNIVVDNEETAKSAMYTLKIWEDGRATFLPITSVKPQDITKEMKDAMGYTGYIGIANELVQSKMKLDDILSSLLGRTLIFDTIDHATVMAKDSKFRVKVVTLDGQQINVGGSFTGGSVKTGNGVLSRASEIRHLEEEIAKQNKTIQEFEKKLSSLSNEIQRLNDLKSDEEQKKDVLSLMQSTEQAQLEQCLAKKDANDSLLEKIRSDLQEYENQKEQRKEEIARLKTEETELKARIEELKAFRSEENSKQGNIQNRIDELAKELTKLYIAVSEAGKDIETSILLKNDAEARLERLKGESSDQADRIRRQQDLITAKEDEMSINRTVVKSAQERLDDLQNQRNDSEKDSNQYQEKMNAITQKLHDKMEQKQLIFQEYTKEESKLAGLQERLDHLTETLWNDYEITREGALALGYPAITKENRQETFAIQTDCKNQLKALGRVDFDAIQKYAEVKQQYDYYAGQITDLTKSQADLDKIIADLEADMKTSFVNSFNKINENFGKVFAELFGGGSAELSLSDPDNVLESGIEIKAAPPGKIIKNLMQLSGGEQAFIGVALFFAILQVNPTPFCILDEIEAALDEVNVERLAQYIKRYSHGTQFIMITHRRGTMAAADRLYGVTMPEHGISKVLLLDTNDISKKEGEDWNGIFG